MTRRDELARRRSRRAPRAELGAERRDVGQVPGRYAMPDHQLPRSLHSTRWLLLVLVSCALTPSGEHSVPDSLRRYEEVASFLLPGYQSMMFYTLALDRGPATGGPLLFARCGSDFQAPHGVGYGPYRGVEVLDLGPAGIVDETQAGEPSTIGGVPVWHLRPADGTRSGPAADTWIAHVDRRFLVMSHHRDLLESALRRSGRLDQLLLPFADLPALPADSESVVYLLPRPADRTYWGRPVPIERMRVSLCPAQRLRLWHRQPLPEQFTSCSQFAQLPPVTTTVEGWQVTMIELQVDAGMRCLLLDILSGVAIFI